MKQISCLIAVALLPCTAVAWEVDGLRSGITLGEATKVVLSQGESVQRRVEVRGLNGAYSLQLKNGWLGFCLDRLYSYDRFLPGGFEAFVLNTEREAERRGAPTLQSFAVKLEIIATWQLGNDRLALAVSKDGPNQFGFSRRHEDLTVKQTCG